MSQTIWKTREGQEIEIKKMASSHLLATIHMIERKRFEQAVDCAMREPENEWEDGTLQYYLIWPEQYEALIAEAQRRHLIYRAAGDTVRKRIK